MAYLSTCHSGEPCRHLPRAILLQILLSFFKRIKLNCYSRRSLTNYLKEEIIEATQLYIAMAAPKAAVAMINAIDDPTELGLKEKMSAAKDLLDRAGLVKTEKVQVESTGGIMVLPAKEREED